MSKYHSSIEKIVSRIIIVRISLTVVKKKSIKSYNFQNIANSSIDKIVSSIRIVKIS